LLAIFFQIPTAIFRTADLWQQYRELGDVEVTGGPSQAYITALQQLEIEGPTANQPG
jgi:hypothetical protein